MRRISPLATERASGSINLAIAVTSLSAKCYDARMPIVRHWHGNCIGWRSLMIRITATTELQRTVFRIDGRLTAEDVPVLDKKCSEAGRPHMLDLSNLLSADAAGSKKLRELSAGGVEIRGAAPYVQLLIEGSE